MNANCENNNIFHSKSEDSLKWRLNLTSCISNIESGENNNSLMDKNKTNYSSNNNIITTPESGATKARNFYITLAKESPKNISYDSSSDTYDSFHFRETDYCKDTTDTLSDSSYTTEEIATVDMVEYEVASRSASENFYSNDSSSGTEDIVFALVTKSAATESSTSDFADSEESNYNIVQKDSELSSADYWKCVKCKNKQNNPMFRYCERCYQIRKSHFPPRPPQRKRRGELQNKMSSGLDKYVQKSNNNGNCTSLSSLSDIDKNMSSSNKINNSSKDTISSKVPNAITTDVTSNINDIKGFGKFYSNNAKNILGSSISNSASFNNCNLSQNQLSRLSSEKNFSSSDSEGDDMKFNKIIKNNEIQKESCETNATSNFFSTPKFSKNLKRKNPFEISLANNAKRFFVESSSCSSVTNLTNHCSSSNNSSLTTTITANNESSCNVLEKRDTNLVVNDSETDLALEFIDNISNSIKLQKDSGISGGSLSSTSGPSSSQEYFSSQGSVDFVCSSHSNETKLEINSIYCNCNLKTNSTKNPMPSISNMDNLDDTVSEDLDEKDYDFNDDKISLNNDNEDNENTTNLSQSLMENIKGLNNNNILSTSSNNIVQKLKKRKRHRKILSPFNNKIKNKTFENNLKKDQDATNNSDSCIVCLDGPKNGVFVHSRFLHLCCCYRCAVKIWNKNKKCPICNCAVKNIMKIFIH
ncbi:E3 ubiquitin-protein ligase Mdm2-like [Condylostylus longicornis]|uniref:E3 ubiquitin-protein ligase Mdm2-like n=1 Tax=Condylostylus longicornis TaxID=2530218 RepID=UPI00244E47E4|nr:E3 ubiquitin-protein ligase Mdm2-like [Condylostylus longicornis]XP_055371201.1 E3 ubiquitin-protein ligase Mdm2-like [Condylostylus longicornis]